MFLTCESIEPPTPFVHGSTLVREPSGRLRCAWFGGPHEGARETAIWSSVRGPEGWSTPEVVADVGPEPHWNPVLAVREQSVWLFFKVGIYPKRWRTWAVRLGEGAPEELVSGDVGGRGPVKNKPIALSDGTWLAGASTEDDDGWRVFVDRSEDGLRWERGADLAPPPGGFAGRGVIQPTLWATSARDVHLLARSDQGCLFRSDSEDGGRTWSALAPTELPNNNSGVDLAQLRDGRLVLASNPTSGSERTPLVLDLGDPEGREWARLGVLAEGEGEYSYPSVIPLPTGVVVSYTHARERVAVATLMLPR